MGKRYRATIKEKRGLWGIKYFNFSIFGKDNREIFDSMNAHATEESVLRDTIDHLKRISSKVNNEDGKPNN